MAMKSSPRLIIAGVPVDHTTLREAAAMVLGRLLAPRGPQPMLIMGPNAHLMTLAQKHARFAEALRASDLNVPDGMSVVLASRILGHSLPERVTGGDLMEELCRQAALHGLSIFLLGGLPMAARLAARKLQRKYPGLKVAGTYCPPMGFESCREENSRIQDLIAAARPDLLFVAFGAPKQELWMHEICRSLPVGAVLSVGAALDTQAGLRRRAPRWTHRTGLEWFYRLLLEPRRLWRRYLLGNPYFLYLVLRQRFFPKDFCQLLPELHTKS